MVPPQRESPLKPKQSEKKPNQQWVADIVHERNLWHTLAFYFCTVSSAEHKKNAQQHCTTNRDRQFGVVIIAGVWSAPVLRRFSNVLHQNAKRKVAARVMSQCVGIRKRSRVL